MKRICAYEKREGLRDAEKQLEEEVKIAVEWQWAEDDVEKLRNRIEQVRSQINNIEEEHGSNLESKLNCKDVNN